MSEKYHCGPNWMPRRLRKWLSDKFNVCCWLHDRHYETDGQRFEYDKIFLINMVKKSENDRTVIFAIVYYATVRVFGRFHFNKE